MCPGQHSAGDGGRAVTSPWAQLPGQSITALLLMGNYLDKTEWPVCAFGDEYGEGPEVEEED